MKTNGSGLISRIKFLGDRLNEKLIKSSGVDVFNSAQGRILYVLQENGTLTITEISRLTSLAKSTLTSMLERMEESGLIAKTQNEKNRRQILITATEKTKKYQNIYDWLSNEMNEVYYKGFTENEIQNFENKLNRIIENLLNTKK